MLRVLGVAFLMAWPLQAADIWVLGEVHDNAAAHRGQADTLVKIAPKAVVFEMLTPEDAALINDGANPGTVWGELPWPDYALYAPIFDAVGDAVLYGAASPPDQIRAAYTNLPGTFGPEAVQFGLDQPLPEDQQTAREDMQFVAHCEAMPREMMAGMVRVQRFRDARFAQVALEALAAHGPPVAVITGNGHARTDWGVPAKIALAAPEVTTRALAFAEADDGTPFDEITVVPPAEREDPCNAFK